jgi:hypothetical protein
MVVVVEVGVVVVVVGGDVVVVVVVGGDVESLAAGAEEPVPTTLRVAVGADPPPCGANVLATTAAPPADRVVPAGA